MQLAKCIDHQYCIKRLDTLWFNTYFNAKENSIGPNVSPILHTNGCRCHDITLISTQMEDASVNIALKVVIISTQTEIMLIMFNCWSKYVSDVTMICRLKIKFIISYLILRHIGQNMSSNLHEKCCYFNTKGRHISQNVQSILHKTCCPGCDVTYISTQKEDTTVQMYHQYCIKTAVNVVM